MKPLTQAEALAEAIYYIKGLAEMPESALLHYKYHGNTVTHEIGKSARIMLPRLEAAQKRTA